MTCAPQIKSNIQDYIEKNENCVQIEQFQNLKNQNAVNPFRVTLGAENQECVKPVQEQSKIIQSNLAS